MIPEARLALTPLLLVGVACSSGAPPTALGTRKSLCPDHAIQGQVTCHLVTVAENPDRPADRSIDLEVMVLEARNGEGFADPIVVIPGGPGQSATRSPGPRSYFADVFDPLRDDRDIVLLAPRGTAGSGELALEPSADRLFDDLATVVPASWAREARSRLEGAADLEMYTTSHIVDDLEATRVALGYDRLNIYGTSYGTRIAQLYAVRYPEQVRTLVLKAPVPPTSILPLTYTPGAQRALYELFELCRLQESCDAAYPDLEDRFEDLMADLRENPVRLPVANPVSNADEQVEIDDAAFGYLLRNLMMPARGGGTALALIDRASRGDFGAVSSLLPQLRVGYATGLAGGVTLSVIASEDAPRVTERLLREDRDAGFLRGAVAEGMMRTLEEWPRGELPADVFDFAEADIPTLLVTGHFDPATPPAFAREIADRMSDAEVVIFPGGAHSANNFDGLGRIMAEFVESGRTRGLDLSAARDNRPLPLVTPG